MNNLRWILRVSLGLASLLSAYAQGLCNYSTLLNLTPGGSATVGFIASGTAPTYLLVRAVGPSLDSFGISNPVLNPRLDFFNSAGQPFGVSYPTPLGLEPPMSYLAPVIAATGAFPLGGGEQPGVAYQYVAFPPGAYTIRVGNGSGNISGGGTVLIETYTIPAAVAATLPVAGSIFLPNVGTQPPVVSPAPSGP